MGFFGLAYICIYLYHLALGCFLEGGLGGCPTNVSPCILCVLAYLSNLPTFMTTYITRHNHAGT